MRTKFKKTLGIVIAFIMAAGLMPIGASATEETNVVSVTTGAGSVPFSENYQTFNLLLAQDAQTGDENDIKLDYTFSVNTADLRRAYEADPENKNYPMGEEQAHKRYFYCDFYLSVEGSAYIESEDRYVERTLYSQGMDSEFAYIDLSTNENLVSPSYKNWSPPYYKELDFVTFSGSPSGASFRINATIADIKDCLLELKPEYSDINITDIYFSSYAGWEASGPEWQGGGRRSYDNKSVVIYDKHVKDVYYELPWETTIDRLYRAEYGINYILLENGLTEDDFLFPTSVKYTWNYYFSHEGFFEILDEHGNHVGYEDCGAPWNFNGDVYAVYRHANGKTYGACMGSIEKTEPTFKIREIITPENKALIMDMVGVTPIGASGGRAHMGISCDVEFTYSDGVTYFLKSPAGMDEMMHLVAPCIHTCTTCGQCSAAENLSCNTDRYNPNMRTSLCTCESPSTLVVEAVVADNIVVNETPYNVSIDKIQPPTDSSEGTYFEVIENIVPEGNVQMVYNVNVLNNYGESFNSWDGSCATVTFEIPTETATGLTNGNLEVVHIDTKTNTQEVFVPSTDETAGTHGTYTVAQDGESSTLSVSSTSFSPIVIVEPAAHSHVWATAWSNNENFHWHACEAEGCDLTDISKMAGYGRHAHVGVSTLCHLCGYGVETTLSASDTGFEAVNGTDKAAVLLIASYTKDNILIDVKVFDVLSGETVTKQISETGLNTQNAETVKAMLFDSLQGIKPLVPAVNALK